MTTAEFLGTHTLDKNLPIFFDIETEELYYHSSLMQFRHNTSYLVKTDTDSEVDLLKEWLVDKHLVGWNLSYDFGTLDIVSNKVDDLFYAVKIAYPQFQEFSLDKVVAKLGLNHLYEGIDKKTLQKKGFMRKSYLSQNQLKYANSDVEALELIWKDPKVQKVIQHNQAYKLAIIALKEVIVWQQNGLPVIKSTLDKYLKLARDRDLEFSHKLEEVAGFPLNPRSSKQVKELLELNSSNKATLTRVAIEGEIKESKKSTSGRGITEKAKKFTDREIEIAELILQARKARNDISKLEGYVGNSKLHGRFNPIGTSSSRWSCKGTTKGSSRPELFNAQNYSRDFKATFGVKPGEGRIIVAADYATLEIRIAACMMGEENMYKALMDGADIHKTTAALVYDKPIDEIHGKERSNAKVCNFGLTYGMGANTFIQYAYDLYGIKFTEKSAKELIGKFFKAYPKIKEYHTMVGHKLNRGGYITQTALDYRHKPKMYAEGINSPIQGTGGECMRLALHKLIELDGRASKYIINSIHDAAYLLVPEEEKDYWSTLLTQAMQEAWYVIRESPMFKWHDVPMPVDIMTGYNMGELEEDFAGGGQSLSLDEMREAKKRNKL